MFKNIAEKNGTFINNEKDFIDYLQNDKKENLIVDNIAKTFLQQLQLKCTKKVNYFNNFEQFEHDLELLEKLLINKKMLPIWMKSLCEFIPFLEWDCVNEYYNYDAYRRLNEKKIEGPIVDVLVLKFKNKEIGMGNCETAFLTDEDIDSIKKSIAEIKQNVVVYCPNDLYKTDIKLARQYFKKKEEKFLKTIYNDSVDQKISNTLVVNIGRIAYHLLHNKSSLYSDYELEIYSNGLLVSNERDVMALKDKFISHFVKRYSEAKNIVLSELKEN